MSDAYADRRGMHRENKENKKRHKRGKLIIKQTLAAIICIAAVWSMKSIPLTKLNGYADALGRAIRYETNLDMIKQLTGDMIKKFSGEKAEY